MPDSAPQVGTHPRWLFPAAIIGIVVAGAAFIWLLVGIGLDRADKVSGVTAMALGLLLAISPGLQWLHRRRAAPATGRAAATDRRWGYGDVVIGTGRLDELPDWPGTCPGYRYADKGTAAVRVFGGQGPVVVDGFPVTMNGCDHQRFFVRWRTLGGQQVSAEVVSTPDLIPIAEAAEGSAGWMASHGCGQPSWTNAIVSQIVDVYVSWQRWVPEV